MKNEVTKCVCSMCVVSALWPPAITKPNEKKERMPWGLCGLALPTEGKANN